eukprot:1494809-Amphidinium_carterae.1
MLLFAFEDYVRLFLASSLLAFAGTGCWEQVGAAASCATSVRSALANYQLAADMRKTIMDLQILIVRS